MILELQLKAIRANADYSLEQLAEKLGCGKSTVWRWEHQLSPMPPKMFEAYCAACGADDVTKEALRKRLNIQEKGRKVQ
ncbi:XRE family transcriptional regulator [Ruminococcus sp. OM05-10BH]|nr:XRE family transcriptional regulator [Ruminococcus sp. OM05-10BH]